MAGTMAAYSDDIEQLPFDLAGVAQWTFRQLDAEQAHNVGLWCAMHGLLPRERRPDPPSLRTTVWGRHFSNPVGTSTVPGTCNAPMPPNADLHVWALQCHTTGWKCTGDSAGA